MNKTITTAVATIALGFTLTACSTAAPVAPVAPPVTVTQTVASPEPAYTPTEEIPVAESVDPTVDATDFGRGSDGKYDEKFTRMAFDLTWDKLTGKASACEGWNALDHEPLLDAFMQGDNQENFDRNLIEKLFDEKCAGM